MKTLGQTLKEARSIIPLTLMQVEEATGISNAYLSQLENDKIKKPSANVLFKLSNIYNIKLDDLLAACGIIEKPTTSSNKMLQKIVTAAGKLSTQEEEELLNYLRYLRSKK